MTRLPWIALSLLAAAAPATAQAPGDSAALAAFVEQVRAGTARYRDRNTAIADGYRALGPDAPGMGQHWMHPGLVLAGRFDPSRPQVLNYITLAGRPVLAGAAFALPLEGTDVPAGVAGRDAWHFHGRSVDEESFLADHNHGPAGTSSGTRVAVLHAWVWQPNPAGLFEPDNWSLPFVRLGIEPPAASNREAAMALSLTLPGGEAFLARAHQADANRLATTRSAVAQWLGGRHAGPLSEAELHWLAERWRRVLAP